MAHALLDSKVLIDVLRGRPVAHERMLQLRTIGDVPCTSAINVEEIFRGLRAGETPAAEMLFGGLHVLPLGSAEGRLAGEWRRDHAQRGVTLSQADCLIAATAHLAGGRLCTGNPNDFPKAPLVVEHWLVGH
jgi:predicted nucleic acid-binding protein